MNALFLTQSRSLEMFYDLMQVLRTPLDLQQCGFLVADRSHYRSFQLRHPELESGQIHLLKEWEFVKRAKTGKPDLARLNAYEAALGNPTLWSAIVADRRVINGPLCTVRPDYRLRFDYDGMLRILEEGLIATERLFDVVQPDVVFSFICVTLGEYLAHLVARQRGVRVLNLRPTRIQNYVTLAPSISEPSATIHAAFQQELERLPEDDVVREARAIIESVRGGNTKYEGVIAPSRKPPKVQKKAPLWRRLPKGLVAFAQAEVDYYIRGDKDDNHIIDPFTTLLYARLLNPWQASSVNRRLDASYVRTGDLPSLNYAFFPLHTEPEISLLVHSRCYLNQIEVVRNVAQNLPVGMLVVVKEHPWAVGKRSMGYYRKLLQIPNVRLADPGLSSGPLIEHARLVTTIAGSIGFEAAMRQKPVITFGHTPYEMLPATMVHRVVALEQLGMAVRDLLANYFCDEQVLVSYVAATMRCSTRVNIYSGLLGREGVYVPDRSGGEQTDIERLAALAIQFLVEGVLID